MQQYINILTVSKGAFTHTQTGFFYAGQSVRPTGYILLECVSRYSTFIRCLLCRRSHFTEFYL